MPTTPRPAPLVGVRVLDMTRLLPGGYATQMLADLGAEVIKVEEPGAGDYARTMPPYVNGVGQAFLAVNRDKRSIALDLKSPAGRETFLRLAERADVVIESFRPGVMARLGLDAEALLARNPRLIVCSLSGYGQTGPYAQRAGHDLNYIGYAGLLGHLRRAGEPPTMPGAQFADLAGGGLMAVVGILAALASRATTGQGRVVDVAMMEGALALLPLFATALMHGEPEPDAGAFALDGALPCYNVYECADGHYITFAALEPKFWETFCRAVERPDLITRHLPESAEAAEATKREVAAIFATQTRDEWVARLGALDACVGPVNTLAEALADPQVIARGAAAPHLRLTPLIDGAAESNAGGYPQLGEHTRAVLSETGFTDAEIDTLYASGAVA